MSVVRSIGAVGLTSVMCVACVLGARPARAQAPGAHVSEATRKKAAATHANPDALVIEEFDRRIAAYMAIHMAAVKDSPPIKGTGNAADIQAAQLAVAAKIRAARIDARPSDIFSEEIRNKFRRLIYPVLHGKAARATLASVNEDVNEADEPKQKLMSPKVNAAYPDGNALPTTPANVLAILPKLPEEIEYRFVEKKLILRDVQANIVIDYFSNAIQ